MLKTSSRPGGRRPAAAAVEFAFMAPVFFLMLLGIFEYARFLFTAQLMDNAAREGARYAVVNTATASTTNVQTYVDSYLAGQGAQQFVSYDPVTNITVFKADPSTAQNTGLSWLSASWGDGIGVAVSGTYQPITPGLFFLTGSVSVQATCVMTCEAN
jgi:Flp pilus assembly protein TadG